MKFICDQRTLHEAISSVTRFVPSRPTHPVLGNIKIVANATTLTLTGFDLAAGLETSFFTSIEEDGAITVPAKLFADIIARLSSGDVAIAVEDDSVTITSETGVYNVRGISAGEYPDFPLVESPPIQLPVGCLKAGIASVIYAASTDETKQILTGVHLKQSESNLVFAATDGHRLATTTVKLEENTLESESLAVTIPSRALGELDRLIAKRDDTEMISIYLDASQAKLAIGDFTLFCRILEGAYPHFEQLIPAQFSRTVTVEAKRLLSALDRVGCLADQKNNLISLTIDAESNRMKVSTSQADFGQASETIPVDAIGESIDIGFNLKYLLAAVKAVRSLEIQIKCNESNQPVILSPLTEEKGQHLIMPVQVTR